MLPEGRGMKRHSLWACNLSMDIDFDVNGGVASLA
jgi:hypothetical protein